ncbi:MAG: acyl carrier protein [Polyangiaceae bacterium]|nr:acyl carrier protein [Polyangiaceae bacterium]
MVNNIDKLSELLTEVFLLEPEEFSLELKRADVETWDSLGIVAMAVGIKDEFGYHFTPEEATSIESVQDIITILTSKGITFDG